MRYSLYRRQFDHAGPPVITTATSAHATMTAREPSPQRSHERVGVPPGTPESTAASHRRRIASTSCRAGGSRRPPSTRVRLGRPGPPRDGTAERLQLASLVVNEHDLVPQADIPHRAPRQPSAAEEVLHRDSTGIRLDHRGVHEQVHEPHREQDPGREEEHLPPSGAHNGIPQEEQRHDARDDHRERPGWRAQDIPLARGL